MAERAEIFREEVILRELRTNRRVTVRDLADQLGVSEVTIRKDLDTLEERSLLRRVRGGAVTSGGEEGAFTDRMSVDAGVKRAIAREVALQIDDGDTIGIDSSTTSYYLAQELVDRDNLIVVTFGLRVALFLLEQTNATVVLPGGVVRRASGGMVGSFGGVLEGRGRIAKGFFGTATVSDTLGMLELSPEEAATKRALVASCDEIHVSFASSKIGRFGLTSYAGPSEVTRLYTDENASDAFVSTWERLGVGVVRVPGTQALADVSLPEIERGEGNTEEAV